MDFILPICVCVVLPVLIVWLVTRARQNEANKKAEIMLKAIENGVQIDPGIFKPSGPKQMSVKQSLLEKLTGACVMSFMGIAFIALGVISYTCPAFGSRMPFLNFVPYGGGVLLAIGLALLISYLVGRRMLASDIEAEERALRETKGDTKGQQ